MASKVIDISHRTQFIEVFLFGALGAWASSRFGQKLELKPRTWQILETVVAVTLTILLFYVCAITCQKFLWYERSDYQFRFQSWLFAIVFTGLLFIVETHPSGFLARFFENALLRFMGILGFSWYLLHFPIFYLVSAFRRQCDLSFAGESLVFFLLSWIACAVICWITFRLVELPGMALGRAFERTTKAR